MLELITLTGAILSQANKLMENETVGKAVKSVVNWIGGVLAKPSAKEKLQQIETNQNIEENVSSIKSHLEFVLEDNHQLQEQLAEMLKEIQQLMQKEGIPMPAKTNTMNISGNANVAFQDVNTQGNIIINK